VGLVLRPQRNSEVMGENCGKLESIQTKKGAGVWPAVVYFGLQMASQLQWGQEGVIVMRGGHPQGVSGSEGVGALIMCDRLRLPGDSFYISEWISYSYEGGIL